MFVCACVCVCVCEAAPLLLDVKQSDIVSVFEKEVASPSVEDALARRTLHFLGHLVVQVLDDQL